MTNTTECASCGSVDCVSFAGWRCPLALIAVDAARLADFAKTFAKLARRAVKLGCEVPTFTVETEWSVVHFAKADKNAPRKAPRSVGGSHVMGVRVTGPRPCFAGWSLVATLEPLDGGNGVNLIKSVPGAGELPASFRTGTQCDHCVKSRARSETFVVRHEDGRMMRVGRNCIADFLGGTSPANVALLFTLATDCASFGGDADESEGGWGARGPSSWDLVNFVGLVIREINANGWVSRSAAQGREVMASADAALDRMLGNPFTGRKAERADEAELATAKAAIEHCANLDGSSDFDHNVRAIASSGSVAHKTAGMAAAIYGVHQRHLEREVARREFAKASADSVHVGTAKARLDLTLTVTAVFDAESQFGVTHIHTMVDASGNVFKWFASSERLAIGIAYTVRGTVKGHGEYKGRKETILTRCKAERVEATA